MLNVIENGARVPHNSLEEAKDEMRESGRGLTFWRETLEACVRDDAKWNDFLIELWQSGGEREAERLDRTFPKDAPRHWLLVALEIGTNAPWSQFLAVWKEQGDVIVDEVVQCAGFMRWLKEVQPVRHALMNRVFGTDSWRWEAIYLVKSFLRMNDNDLLMTDGSQAFRFVKCVEEAFKHPKKGAAALVAFLETEKCDFLVDEGKNREIEYWKQFIDPESGTEMSITLPGGVPMIFCWCSATANSEGFWMGKWPVTRKQWTDVMGTDPGDQPDASPLSSVKISLKDCVEFIEKVNAENSIKVQLPTQSQWEHAHRTTVEDSTPNAGFLQKMKRNIFGIHWGVCEMADFDSEWNRNHEIGLIGAINKALSEALGVLRGENVVRRGAIESVVATGLNVAVAMRNSALLRKFRLVCSLKPHR